MQTQVIISLIATLALIGLALASVIAEADFTAEARMTPGQASHPPAEKWVPYGSPALDSVLSGRADAMWEDGC